MILIKFFRAFAFSPESKCPNEYASDPQSQCSTTTPGAPVWNSKGSGLLRRDIPFPILLSLVEHNEDIDKIEECYKRYFCILCSKTPLPSSLWKITMMGRRASIVAGFNMAGVGFL